VNRLFFCFLGNSILRQRFELIIFVAYLVKMTIEECFYIGYISKTRGLKGELQLFFEFDDYTALDLAIVFVEINKKLVPYFVDEVKFHNNHTAYINFEDIDHIDKAQPLIRKQVYLSKDKMPVRDPEDFRYTDLIGYLAIDEKFGELGEITHVQEMPQQFIATVQINEQEALFPLNEDLIKGIDREEKLIVIDLPEGLIDMYLDLP